MRSGIRGSALLILLYFQGVAATPAPADKVQFLRNIAVQPGEICGDAVCILCSIDSRGNLTGDAVAIGGSIVVDGKVEGDAVALGGGVHLSSTASLGGEAVAIGGPVVRAAQSTIAGGVEQMPYFHLPGQRRLYLRGALALVVCLLVAAVIFHVLFRPGRVGVVAGVLRERPGVSLLAGLGVCAAAILLYYISDLSTRFGSILSTLISVVVLVVFGLGYAGFSLSLGRRLRPGWSPLRCVAIGSVASSLLLLVPLVGTVGIFVVILLAFGGTVLSRFGSARHAYTSKGDVPGITPTTAN